MASPSRSLQRLQHRFRATARSYTEGPDVKAVDKTRVRHNARSRAEVALARAEKPFAALTTTEKVIEGTKTTGSVGVIAAGLGLFSYLGYTVAKEAFFSDSPEALMKNSETLILTHPKVVERFGESVKIYGSGKGGRRGTIECQEYSVAGKGDFLRLKFYVDGTECKGTVHGEFRKVDGNWKCRWMFLDAGQSMVHRAERIMLVDTRAEELDEAIN